MTDARLLEGIVGPSTQPQVNFGKIIDDGSKPIKELLTSFVYAALYDISRCTGSTRFSPVLFYTYENFRSTQKFTPALKNQFSLHKESGLLISLALWSIGLRMKSDNWDFGTFDTALTREEMVEYELSQYEDSWFCHVFSVCKNSYKIARHPSLQSARDETNILKGCISSLGFPRDTLAVIDDTLEMITDFYIEYIKVIALKLAYHIYAQEGKTTVSIQMKLILGIITFYDLSEPHRIKMYNIVYDPSKQPPKPRKPKEQAKPIASTSATTPVIAPAPTFLGTPETSPIFNGDDINPDFDN